MCNYLPMFLCGKRLLLIALLFFSINANAATVDTINIYSETMHKSYKCVVVKPKDYKKKSAFPVVYLLHGYSGSYANWVSLAPAVKAYADQYKMIIVCPDGGFSSWYFDSPLDTSYRFETYINKEVPAYIDKHYKTIPDRKARAITGLSMGGHGGLFLGFRHAATFGACGSMSGGVDMRPFPKNWDIRKRIGDSATYAANWKNYSVTSVIEQQPKAPLAVIIDCGTEDFFYKVNKSLHEKMLQLKIAHEYIERPGQHDWLYWANAVKYQLLFFHNYFESIK